MNVKVITRHGPSNYGSLLQSVATIEAINSLGHQVEIIDYQRADERGMQSVRTALNKKTQWSNNGIKSMAYLMTRWPEEYVAQARFDGFRKKYLPMTKRFKSADELDSIEADLFITGSDQVWGPIGKDDYDAAYFLSFVTKGRKAAYAASFGRTDFNETIRRNYASLLAQYDGLSVREDSAREVIKDLIKKDVPQVLDPTLLLNEADWAKVIGFSNDFPQGKYLLIYQIHNNPGLNHYALALSKLMGLPVFRVSPTFHQFNRGGKFIYLPEPSRFLSLIKNAEMMVTDSFHGTAFAINLNTPFVEILPSNGTHTRNQSILKLTGLQNRIVTDTTDMETPFREINFEKVNEIIDLHRKESLSVLRDMLK